MRNKEQILVVPVNYVSHIGNNFTGTSLSTKSSYVQFDSTGLYEPRYKIDNNICLIKIAVVLIFKDKEGKYLVKESKNKKIRPCIELGINSYIEPDSGNYKALYNQINTLCKEIGLDTKDTSNKFIGYIRDLTNDCVKSTLGMVYYIDTNKDLNFSNKSKLYSYEWYTLKELVDRYTKTTSWSKILIDNLLVENIIL